MVLHHKGAGLLAKIPGERANARQKRRLVECFDTLMCKYGMAR